MNRTWKTKKARELRNVNEFAHSKTPHSNPSLPSFPRKHESEANHQEIKKFPQIGSNNSLTKRTRARCSSSFSSSCAVANSETVANTATKEKALAKAGRESLAECDGTKGRTHDRASSLDAPAPRKSQTSEKNTRSF
jgi:hypothetical protein